MANDALSKAVAEQLNTGVLVLDSQLHVVEFNRFMQVHTDKVLDDVIGKNIYQVFPELPKRWFERKVAGVLQLNTPSFCSWEQRHHLFELPHTRPITTDSHFMAQNCTFLPIEVDNKVEHVCILIEDATDVAHYQAKLNRALEDLALANRIDGLTQIFNRKHWEECLDSEFSRARRYDHDVALIMFDLDHFKLLNDTYGHQCGDYVLVETAKLVDSLLRICDLFGRYGGEEFGVILPETDLAGAMDVAERIRSEIGKTVINFQNEAINISVSVGVALINPDDNNYEDLISNTDIALYESKAKGRNIVTYAKEKEVSTIE